MNINIKERSAEVSILVAILLGVLIYFGFRPLLVQLHKKNVDLKVKKQELTQKEQKRDTLQAMKSKLTTYKTDLEMMKRALPKGEDVPSLLVSTEALVAYSGLGMTSFTPPGAGTQQSQTSTSATSETEGTSTTRSVSSRTQKVGIDSASYSLTLNGSYPAFIAFLNNTDKNVRPTSINSINITSGGDPSKPLTFSLKMVSYYQK